MIPVLCVCVWGKLVTSGQDGMVQFEAFARHGHPLCQHRSHILRIRGKAHSSVAGWVQGTGAVLELSVRARRRVCARAGTRTEYMTALYSSSLAELTESAPMSTVFDSDGIYPPCAHPHTPPSTHSPARKATHSPTAKPTTV